jgi:hypothetical protein
MNIDDLAKLMRKNRKDVERMLKSSDVIELNLNDDNEEDNHRDDLKIKFI